MQAYFLIQSWRHSSQLTITETHFYLFDVNYETVREPISLPLPLSIYVVKEDTSIHPLILE